MLGAWDRSEGFADRHCVAEASASNPSVLAAKSLVQSLCYQVEQAYANFYPQLTSSLTYNYGNSSVSTGSHGTFNAGVQAKYNVFAGQADVSRVAQSIANRDAAQADLKAFQSQALSDTTLALFGSAKREDFERQGHTVPFNVKFLGFVSDEELSGLLQQAIALAFPSITEGFGLPPLEAMALGCPTVVAPCGALPEVCGDASLWAHPRQPDEWVRHIVQLRDDGVLRAEMKCRGLAQAALFSWDRAARRLLEIATGRSLTDIGLMQPARSDRHTVHSSLSLIECPSVTPPLLTI